MYFKLFVQAMPETCENSAQTFWLVFNYNYSFCLLMQVILKNSVQTKFYIHILFSLFILTCKFIFLKN